MAKAIVNKDILEKLLAQWQDATQAIADLFVQTYFIEEEDDKPDCYWVSDDIGGVFYINDFFFGVNDMIDFMRYEYTQEEMIEYYYYALKEHEAGKQPINIYTYKKQK